MKMTGKSIISPQCNMSNILCSLIHLKKGGGGKEFGRLIDWCFPFSPPKKKSNNHHMCPVLTELCFEYDYAIQLYVLLLKKKKIFPIKIHLQRAPYIHISKIGEIRHKNDTKLFFRILDIISWKKCKEIAKSKTVRIVPQQIRKLQHTAWHRFKKTKCKNTTTTTTTTKTRKANNYLNRLNNKYLFETLLFFFFSLSETRMLNYWNKQSRKQ